MDIFDHILSSSFDVSEKIVNQLFIDKLKMPTKIYIGDVELFNSENEEIVFSKNFKCKSKWVGEANLKKIELKNKDSIECADYLTIIYAPTQKLLNTYKNKAILEQQKVSNLEALTISQNIRIKINDNYLDLNLKNEGLFADILEICNKSGKLEGLVFNLYLGDNNFTTLKNKIEELLQKH